MSGEYMDDYPDGMIFVWDRPGLTEEGSDSPRFFRLRIEQICAWSEGEVAPGFYEVRTTDGRVYYTMDDEIAHLFEQVTGAKYEARLPAGTGVR